MKRRVMIAKALAHEPDILFLDEPTAGVDVELRRDMWELVRRLREDGTTIILTTHYIEEAEEMADRVGVINKGELILVEEKHALMQKLGRKMLHLQLAEPLAAIPPELAEWRPQLRTTATSSDYEFDAKAERTGIPSLLTRDARRSASPSRTSTPSSRASRTFSSAWSTSSGSRGARHELARHLGDLQVRDARASGAPCGQGLAVPVITTSLYFVVFGAAIGSRMSEIDGIDYGSFIVPGLIMLSLFTRASSTPASASTCRASPARSTSSCPRRCRRSRRCSAMSARRRPSR